MYLTIYLPTTYACIFFAHACAAFVCLCLCTLTGPAVRVEDEAGVTGAGVRAGDVGTQLLAVTIAAFINICLKKKKETNWL